MEYLNEHLWVGQLGHILVVIAFVAALFSGVAYFLSGAKGDQGAFKGVGSSLYYLHALSLVGVVALFAFMIINHFYEYQYVWKYSSNEMQFKYIFSCFWAGQEGSFLTWIFFQMFLGLFLMHSKYKHISSVMGFYGLIQAFLMTMILGVYLGDLNVGINPFTLLREAESNLGLPWTMNENYLSLPTFMNGQGLNPLLQNYWMTIHPPTIFVGFAAGAVPFAYALGALLNKDFYDWVKGALVWNFFGVMIMGLGILMGGAWAYESLNFGGFWAWDPVENAILIPWLVMVGAAHLMLLLKLRKKAVFATFIMTIATFVLVVYSTFLTRSGVLGDTSVHSFTGDGLMFQLILFQVLSILVSVVLLTLNQQRRLIAIISGALVTLLCIVFYFIPEIHTAYYSFFFLIVAAGVVFLLIKAYTKDFPVDKEEDPFLSREFWMFTGAIILVISGVFVMVLTSMPVWQIIFGTDYSGPVETQDRYDIYNPIMALFAILVSVFMGVAQLLKYKNTPVSHIKKGLLVAFLIGLVALIPIMFLYDIGFNQWINLILAITAVFAIVTNIDYWKRVVKGQVLKAGSAIAHIGLSLILVGSVISMGGQKPISKNTSGTDVSQLSSSFSNDKNIQLIKNEPVPMGAYFIKFKKKFYDGPVNLNYEIVYFDRNEDETVGDSLFSLFPFVQMNENFGKVSEPGTKHYWNKDVFTYIKYADFDAEDDDWMSWQDVAYNEQSLLVLKQNDTVHKSGFIWRCGALTNMHEEERAEMGIDSTFLGAMVPIEITGPNGHQYFAKVSLAIQMDGKESQYKSSTDTVEGLNIALTMMPRGLDPEHISVMIANFNPVLMAGNAIKSNGVKVVLDSNELKANNLLANVPALKMDFEFTSKTGLKETGSVYNQLNKDTLISTTFNATVADFKLQLKDYDFEQNRVSLAFSEKEFLIMEATEFPLIILIWIGTILMTLGTLIAVFSRFMKNRVHGA